MCGFYTAHGGTVHTGVVGRGRHFGEMPIFPDVPLEYPRDEQGKCRRVF